MLGFFSLGFPSCTYGMEAERPIMYHTALVILFLLDGTHGGVGSGSQHGTVSVMILLAFVAISVKLSELIYTLLAYSSI